MARIIKNYRGLKANLPILEESRIAFTTDTKETFIGSSTGNIELAKQSTIGDISTLNWLPENLIHAIEDIKKWQDQQSINVRSHPYYTLSDGTDDSAKIQLAIDSASLGGYLRFPPGTYSIAKTINIDNKNILIQGSGHSTIFKWIGATGGTMFSLTGKGEYGQRGGGIRDIIVDGNGTAGVGMYIGHKTGTVVGQFFANIRVQNCTNGTAIILDALQNNYFELIDTEYCKTGLYLVNGAGNNLFNKCSFADAYRGGHNIVAGKDIAFAGYGKNAFADTPQANTFYACVIERGTSASLIKLKETSDFRFMECEFASNATTVAAIDIDSTSTFTHIGVGRFAGGGSTNPAILNKGYVLTVDGCRFENYPTDEVVTSNKTMWGTNHSNLNNGRARIRNSNGDPAENIRVNSAPAYATGNQWSYPDIDLLVGEFHHNSYDEMYFRSRNKNNQVVMSKNKNFITNVASATTSTQTYSLSDNGSWMVEVCVSTGDKQHSRSQLYVVRHSDIPLTGKLSDVQMVGVNTVGGRLITLVSLKVNSKGILSLTGTASASTTMIFSLRAVCQIQY